MNYHTKYISDKNKNFVFTNIKLLALELVNLCLNYDFACKRFLEFNITKSSN
jgi:hypothetical protein